MIELGVAEARQIPGRRDRHDAVGDKEGELVELCFKVVEMVDDHHALDERVDQIGDEGPDEKQDRHIDDGENEA